MECICNAMRKSSRAVSNFYDKMLAPSGLRVTQYTMLRVLSRERALSLGDLAIALDIDQTSATRSVATLEQGGLLERVSHHDPRVKLLKVTDKGKAALKAASASWQEAQKTMLDSISIADWNATMRTLEALASASLALPENR